MTEVDESNPPRLTPIQRIELERLEALIVENLQHARKPKVSAPDAEGIVTAVFSADGHDDPAATERHIKLHAELICYLAAEGIDYSHFHGELQGAKFMFSFSACSILRERAGLFEEPESFGCQVLLAAGFRPPEGSAAQT